MATVNRCFITDNHNPHTWYKDGRPTECVGVGPIGGETMDAGLKSDPTAERTAQVLTDWWLDLAREEVERVAPKAVEYGSTDLIEIGRDLAQMMGLSAKDDAFLAELGIYFYMVGKMARWRDAIHRQVQVSDDTLHDIGVYVRMTQRVRAVGGWPFNPNDPVGDPTALAMYQRGE